MKPVSFDFVQARKSCRGIADRDGGERRAQLVAGCQSLGPMLNLRLATPRMLIDLTGIPELTRIEDDRDSVTIGACVTHSLHRGRAAARPRHRYAGAGCAQHRLSRSTQPRNDGRKLLSCRPGRGLGFDPVCFRRRVHCILPITAARRIPADQFIPGAYENALMPGEILEAIKIPRLSECGRCGYYKVCRKAGDFASALGAILYDPEREPLPRRDRCNARKTDRHSRMRNTDERRIALLTRTPCSHC